MGTEDLLTFKIGLSLLPKVGSVTAKKLVAYCGGVEAIFKESKSALSKIPGIGKQLVDIIATANVLDRAKKECDFVTKHQITCLFYLDANYPNRLKQCGDAPILLYLKGKPDLNHCKIISIVGTRKATEQGKSNCQKLLKELSAKGYEPLIVSGLAYGIDICAHKAALENKLPTIGVIAHGLDNLYPSLHRETARQMIADNGGVVTEFVSGTKIDPHNFVKRNRIIAGIADATIVVESAAKGGALITADISASYNRDVFAYPGRVTDKYSKGCNYLIKTNKAAIIESAEDLEVALNWDIEGKPKLIQRQLFVELSDEEQLVADVLKEGKVPIDVICRETKFPVSKVSTLLLNLEFSGVVKCHPGKIYSLYN